MLNEKIKKLLERQHYKSVGNHSAVQICKYTKDSLNNRGVCWKEKFYGIKSSGCCQFSPWLECQNQCLHCWRPIEESGKIKISRIDNPKEILDGIMKARAKLLTGFKSNKNTGLKRYEEAREPSLFTMSLSGEATLYPKLAEMIKEIRRRKAVSFLVTNGLEPGKIKELEIKDALPTQITVSTNAPNEKLFKIWHRSSKKNAWHEFNKTLDILKKLKGKTRRVIRLTLARQSDKKNKIFIDKLSNMTDENVKEYANLVRKAEPDFIHVKGFKSVGYSRERLGYDKMPWHNEVVEFAKKLVKELKKEKYKILSEEEASCVVLLGRDKKNMKIKKSEI